MARDRFTWNEMRRYWRAHSERWAVDEAADPEGLGNVCYAGAPLWLNRHYARYQRLVFESLLAKVPAPGPDARALDVGCGAGRWSRLLFHAGYDVTGIDLQPELIDRNRARFPGIRFENVAVQDFSAPPFDLVCSVTVIQHVPYDEQDAVVERIRALAKDGGHAIVLENTHADAPHVFPRSLASWRTLFERVGFQTLSVLRYDYSPFLRLAGMARTAAARAAGRARPHESSADPEELVSRVGGRDSLSRLSERMNRAAAFLDRGIEPLLIKANPAASSVHCGFLFRVPGGG